MPAISRAVVFAAHLSGATGPVSIGKGLLYNAAGTRLIVATDANRTATGRKTAGISLTAGDNDDVQVEVQFAGPVPPSVSGLGDGDADTVYVDENGDLARGGVLGTDDIVGRCDADGTVYLLCGGMFYNTVSGSVSGDLVVSGSADVGAALTVDGDATVSGELVVSDLVRFGPDALVDTTVFGATMPSANEIGYGYTAASNAWFQVVCGSAAHKAGVGAYNTSAGGSSTTSIGLQAPGATFTQVTGYASQAVIESTGASNHCIVFGQALGSTGLSALITFRLWRGGALCVGDDTDTDTQTEAQGGLSGALIRLVPCTGTWTSAANRVALFNQGGALHLHGHTGVRISTHGVSPASTVTMFGVTWPQPASNVHSLFSNSDDHNIGTFVSTAAAKYALVQCVNTSAGGSLTTGIHMRAPGASAGLTGMDGMGVLEVIGPATAALRIAKALGDGTSHAVINSFYTSGAFAVGFVSNNDTSSEAQAGLTGPMINISQTTGGSQTSTSNQALTYNLAGVYVQQGHAGARTIVNTTVVQDITSTYINNGLPLAGYETGSLPFRLKSVAITKNDATDHTLTAAQYSCPIVKVSGTPGGAYNVIGPNTADTVLDIVNNTASALTIKKTAGTGFTIAANKAARAWHNGTDYERLTPDASPT